MRHRITRIAPLQFGKVFAVLYGLLSIPIALIMLVAAAFAPAEESMPVWLVVAIPVLYVVFGFIFMAIAAWLYNVVARWTGGVEYVTEDVPAA